MSGLWSCTHNPVRGVCHDPECVKQQAELAELLEIEIRGENILHPGPWRVEKANGHFYVVAPDGHQVGHANVREFCERMIDVQRALPPT